MNSKLAVGIVFFFRNYWSGGLGIWGTFLDAVLALMEALYRICVKWRVFAYKHQWLHTVKLDVPVISVGNLAIGGTGKTPFSRWVYEKTLQMEFVPGVISGDMARDESELYKSWNPGGIFINDKSKTKGASVAVSRGANLIVIDDGFQHLGLKRDLNIVLIAAEHQYSEKCLPRGILREPFTALDRADFVVVTRKTAERVVTQSVAGDIEKYVPEKQIGQVHLKFSSWKNIGGATVPEPVGRCLIFTSIAEPEILIELVESITSRKAKARIYPDHYEFNHTDLQYLKEKAEDYNIVTTEKDAVKLQHLGDTARNVFVLHLDLEWERGEQAMMELLEEQRRSV
jgi:tetraacyldisaccharide 4'-kinase